MGASKRSLKTSQKKGNPPAKKAIPKKNNLLSNPTNNHNNNLSRCQKRRQRKKKEKHKFSDERSLLLSVMQRKKLQHYQSSQKNGTSITSHNDQNNPTSSSTAPFLDVRIHRVRNHGLFPKSILRLASSHPTHHSLLAASRENGSVEIYDPNQKWNGVGHIPGMPKRSIDALVWLTSDFHHYPHKNTLMHSKTSTSSMTRKDEDQHQHQHQLPTFSSRYQQDNYNSHSYRRLFGGSISDGTIFELDFTTQQHTHTIGSGGGAVFSLVAFPEEYSSHNHCCGYIAAGCEDGCVRIFRVNESSDNRDGQNDTGGGIELAWTLPTAGAPVLSIAWKRPPSRSGSTASSDEQQQQQQQQQQKQHPLGGSILYAGIADGTIRRYDCVSTSTDGVGPISTNYSSTVYKQGIQWKSSFRMTLENRGYTTPTKVWALQVLSDNTVISGDSLGQVQFWDGNVGILTQSFAQNSQMAPVLDLCVDSLEEKVYAAGVDPRVICIECLLTGSYASSHSGKRQTQQSQSGAMKEWILAHANRPHTHDVRGLAICSVQDSTGGNSCYQWKETQSEGKPYNEPLLCSGGVDTKICTYHINSFREKRPRRMFHMPFMSPVSLAKEKRVFSAMKDQSVDLYQLKDSPSTSLSDLAGTSKALIPSTSSQGGDTDSDNLIGTLDIVTQFNLVCSDISQDGKFLAVSDAANLMIFQIEYIENEEETRLSMAPHLIALEDEQMKEACIALKFYTFGNATQLICATANGPIHVLSISENGDDMMDSGESNSPKVTVQIEHTFKEHLITSNHASCRPGAISLIDVSTDGRYLAVGRRVLGSKSIHVFSLSATYQHHFTLPALEAQPSALKFTSTESSALMVGCVNNSFYIFDTESKSMTDWTKDAGFPVAQALPRGLIHSPDFPVRFMFPPSEPSRFLMVSVLLV